MTRNTQVAEPIRSTINAASPHVPEAPTWRGQKIVTDMWRKPIPTDRFDWTATLDGYEGGDPMGYGATEAEAIADLKEQMEDE